MGTANFPRNDWPQFSDRVIARTVIAASQFYRTELREAEGFADLPIEEQAYQIACGVDTIPMMDTDLPASECHDFARACADAAIAANTESL